jgi:hypothetical protein
VLVYAGCVLGGKLNTMKARLLDPRMHESLTLMIAKSKDSQFTFNLEYLEAIVIYERPRSGT